MYIKKTYKCENCGKVFERTIPFKTPAILCPGCIISKAKKEKFKDPKNKKAFLDKKSKTNLKIYGVENTLQSKEIRAKGVKTSLERYGYVGGFANPNIQDRIQEAAHSKEAYEKKKETSLRKYNVEHWMQADEVKQKLSDTYSQRTGYDNPMYNPDVVRINHTKGYTFENISFDSSWELAYYIWLRDNKKAFIYHPPYYMDYVDDEGTNRIYQPDFLVEGQFYEIKGDQFFNEKGEPYNRYIQKFWWGKYNAIKAYNIHILTLEDVKKYLKYVKDNYGKNYLKQFKNTRIQSSTTIERE